MKRNITHTLIVALLVLAAGAYFLYEKEFPKPEQKAQRITCYNNLKQIGISFRVWVTDHGDTNVQYSFNISTNNGGSRELCARDTNGFAENSVPVFKTMSNELCTPLLLACPQDPLTKRAKSFSDLKPENITYLLHIGTNVSDATPTEVLLFCPIHGYSLLCNGAVLDAQKKEIEPWAVPTNFISSH